MVNCLGLSDTILQCDPEPSLIKWEESAKSKTSRANSHPTLSKIITSQQRSSGKLSETVAGTSAHNAGSTSRPHDEMDCSTCSLAHPSFHEKRCTASILSSHGVVRIVEKLLVFGESVLARLPEVGKGSGNPAPKLADRWKSSVWLGKSDFRRASCQN